MLKPNSVFVKRKYQTSIRGDSDIRRLSDSKFVHKTEQVEFIIKMSLNQPEIMA